MSISTSLSRLSSATRRFSFPFFCSSSFSRRAWSTCSPAKLFPPAVVRLLRDRSLFAGQSCRLSVGRCHFDLPQQAHDLLRRMLLLSCHSRLLSYQFVSFPLVQDLPGRAGVPLESRGSSAVASSMYRLLLQQQGSGARGISGSNPVGVARRLRRIP